MNKELVEEQLVGLYAKPADHPAAPALDFAALGGAARMWSGWRLGGKQYRMLKMRDRPDISLSEMLRESDALAESGYDDWARAKIEQAIAEARDPDKLIPAEEVWRELGLET